MIVLLSNTLIIHCLTASSSGSADSGPQRPAAVSEEGLTGRL